MKRTAIEAFTETIRLFEEQLVSQECCSQDCEEHFNQKESEQVLLNHEELKDKESAQILLNHEELKSRLGEIHESRMRLEQELKIQNLENRETEKKMNSLRPDLIQIRNSRDQHLL